IADMIAINKADGDNRERARLAASDYRAALHLMKPATPTWSPPVLLCSALRNEGLDEIWSKIELHQSKMQATGEFDERRSTQQVGWMRSMLKDRLVEELRSWPELTELLHQLESQVHAGDTTPSTAVETVWRTYLDLRCRDR
ncbi:MAG: methylmalonyl Co-A mutase-associated GTPase MeaB, partial [Microthrixaceae bacterium]|nr:methylmalonyl Co-A mutase-associated GTPase MeaB [Microthrixaceae bacterium]